jgi:hypothetical protein
MLKLYRWRHHDPATAQAIIPAKTAGLPTHLLILHVVPQGPI